ncbi:methylated-DNA--[protein]-cysteine S-methyltransferase [Kitasatospora sp. NBC_01287]|uniref:methylated-DNA--[protein]-cysteine S-methyltransferase n=1 Tax=Kitasatospora sp. NBC_01287 TaxID=2903573 RepID=UPI00224CDC59|nr:methylated-DNA--[protein]-cysteine S-methyltransferase [Kitasatospora sp. NBC_01287]MCX4744570.1 methylated-DNA--[protein]-cysteine S-methyltransferase [Kitasatospora sp. NBC_01287]
MTTTVTSTLYTTTDSPLGELLLVGEESTSSPAGLALRSLTVTGQRRAATVQPDWRSAPGAFPEIVDQLRAYFAGDREEFALELRAGGTEFQQRVWQAIDTIPFGSTTTYGRLAEQIGAPRAAVRAVGTAIGANPLLIVRPCHRIIGANGSLTGYAAGLERKEYLLTHEGSLPAALL